MTQNVGTELPKYNRLGAYFSEVLDETVHPPSGDHTYAHWLEKEAIPPPPQPSLFRNIAKDCSPHFGKYLIVISTAFERHIKAFLETLENVSVMETLYVLLSLV